MSARGSVCSGTLAVLVTIAFLRGQAVEHSRRLESVAPRMASAEAQLGHARRLKRQMCDKEDDELVVWRERTVEAYRAVRVFHPGAGASCVEAAFRAGEILRAGGDESGAREEFRWRCDNGEGSAFRARAGLEIGHVHRRRERWGEAVAAYLEVAADASASAARREDAWLWAGTAWRAQGRVEDARLAWRRVAEQGTDALARIQAFDELGMLLLAEGELEGAAGMLDRCLRALSARALEETEQGERVRNALLRMRIVEELPRAIALRKDSSAARGTPRKS